METATQRPTLKSVYNGRNTDHDASRAWEHDSWTCTLRMGRKSMRTPFTMGTGHDGREPSLFDVLYSLKIDASSFENAGSLEEFCREFGYDSDSRNAERMYRACGRAKDALERVLGLELLAELPDDEDALRAWCEGSVPQ